MKNVFSALKAIIGVIAFLVFVAGLVLTILGGYDLIIVLSHMFDHDKHHLAGLVAMGLLSAVDLFLIAIVFFVLGLGIILLFGDPEKPFPVNLPKWLRVHDFMQLKIILWETILTTLVIGYLNNLAGKKLRNDVITIESLIIPGGIFLVAVSLFFLKKEKSE